MTDVVVAQEQIEIEILFEIRLKIFRPAAIAFVFIGIKHLRPCPPPFSRLDCHRHFVEGILRQDIIMIQQTHIVACGESERLVRILRDSGISLQVHIANPGIPSPRRGSAPGRCLHPGPS